jgi:serine/threonine protein phosphatase PrpC
MPVFHDAGFSRRPSEKHEDKVILATIQDGVNLFGILDGHGGKDVARYAKEALVEYTKESYARGVRGARALQYASRMTEADILDDEELDNQGSTMTLALLHGPHLFTATLGDSKGIAHWNNLTVDITPVHSPDNPSEFARFSHTQRESIAYDGVYRVGPLAMTRSLGDWDIKERHTGVIAIPEMRQYKNYPFSWIILASDGVWDVMTNKQVAGIINAGIKKAKSPGEIAKEITAEAKHKGSLDDISAIIITSKP